MDFKLVNSMEEYEADTLSSYGITTKPSSISFDYNRRL